MYVLSTVDKNGTYADRDYISFYLPSPLMPKINIFWTIGILVTFSADYGDAALFPNGKIVPESGNWGVKVDDSHDLTHERIHIQNLSKSINQGSEEDIITKEGAFKENHVQMLHKKWFGTQNVTA